MNNPNIPIKAGHFEVTIGSGYPIWITLNYQGMMIKSVHHQELTDLEYVVKKALTLVRSQLKPTGEDI